MPNDKDVLSDDDLDLIFSQVRTRDNDDQTADHKAFLNQLSAIPSMHPQQDTVHAGVLSELIDRWLSPSFLLSARGLVSQGAFALVLLASGVATGLELAETETDFYDYDVSASLFGDDTSDYSIDG
ncbi:MAG: hypothetical protein JJ850_04610 [Kordiimonadaceae bacterium]|nr:hypothetical protein [Kordiimonadaceae bacterium]MBO6568399.1 hypothetical protein [Kordiimonadaceae bacterium]MBO6963872.1 hypothetical protein [Kordiimonadaceae bacterium]